MPCRLPIRLSLIAHLDQGLPASLPHSHPRSNVHFFTDRLREPRHSQIFLSLPLTEMIDTKSSVSFRWSSVLFTLATNNHWFSLPVGPL